MRRDLNRRGADKEGSDMDAIVPSTKIDQPEKVAQVLTATKEPSPAPPVVESVEQPVTITIAVKDQPPLDTITANHEAPTKKPDISVPEFDDKDKTPEIVDQVEIKVATPIANEIPDKLLVSLQKNNYFTFFLTFFLTPLGFLSFFLG